MGVFDIILDRNRLIETLSSSPSCIASWWYWGKHSHHDALSSPGVCQYNISQNSELSGYIEILKILEYWLNYWENYNFKYKRCKTQFIIELNAFIWRIMSSVMTTFKEVFPFFIGIIHSPRKKIHENQEHTKYNEDFLY